MKTPTGKDDYAGAVACALACSAFLPDDEDEWVTDDPCSCYNCRRRRWTADSMECMKP